MPGVSRVATSYKLETQLGCQTNRPPIGQSGTQFEPSENAGYSAPEGALTVALREKCQDGPGPMHNPSSNPSFVAVLQFVSQGERAYLGQG